MKVGGLKARPLARWDDGIDTGVAHREFERFGIRAELSFDPITDFHPMPGARYTPTASAITSGSSAQRASSRWLSRTCPRSSSARRLSDVDLFIGVTSIGIDPEWPQCHR